MTNLTKIEGIGYMAAEKFAAIGVQTVEALLTIGRTLQGRRQLSEQTGISVRYITAWVHRADLARIKGIGAEYADLLEEAGLRTVCDVARADAEALQARLIEINQRRRLVRRVPALSRIAEWIAQAQQLPRLIEV